MGVRCRSALLIAVAAWAVYPLPAAAAPAVARARYRAGAEILTAGTVFFLSAPGPARVAAVGAAHSFDLQRLARAGTVEFRLGHTDRRVGSASRLLAAPGRPFAAPGGTMRDDFMLFALDTDPVGVRVLEPDSRALPKLGERVQILGIPATIPSDEDDVFGAVREASAERIEIELDVLHDLRGWGGAPVLAHRSGRVVGILQAAWPTRSSLRVAATPITPLVRSLAKPLEGGRGRALATFPTGLPAPAEPRASDPPVLAGAPSDTGAPAPTPAAAGGETLPDPRAAARPARSILGAVRERPERPIWVEIEHPADGAIIGDPAGAFLAGRALAPRGNFRRIDVVVVIDTSGSTREPTGVDVNGNGVVGKRHLGGLGSVFELGSSDPGDSILAAEVAAARRLLRSLDPRSTRVGLVVFAGDPSDGGGLFRRPRKPALTEVPLTTEYERVERALDRILERGPAGSTHMAAGVDQATIELLGLRGAASEPDPASEKAVLFFTDGRPTLPYGAGFEGENVKAVLRAADRSARAGLQVHTFGIGTEALEGPIAVVELAARTEGVFTPVRHPGTLVDVIDDVNFANVEEIVVHNRTTDQRADPLLENPDGSFSALVPLQAGRNRIDVRARARDGSEAQASLLVHYAPGAPEVPVPRPLVAQHNRLLEQRLLELQRSRVAVERERAEQARRELLIEIERERAQAQERAARQRKELELEIEPRPAP